MKCIHCAKVLSCFDQQIQSDLLLLQRHIRGELSITHSLQEVLDSLCADHIPRQWLSQTFATCQHVSQWVAGIAERVHYVQKCFISHPESFWVPAFLRPDRLFPAVAQTYAKQNFRVVNEITLDFQVCRLALLAIILLAIILETYFLMEYCAFINACIR